MTRLTAHFLLAAAAAPAAYVVIFAVCPVEAGAVSERPTLPLFALGLFMAGTVCGTFLGHSLLPPPPEVTPDGPAPRKGLLSRKVSLSTALMMCTVPYILGAVVTTYDERRRCEQLLGHLP